MIPKENVDCVCEECFLYHPKKDYCSLDGRKHVSCFKNFIPKDRG